MPIIDVEQQSPEWLMMRCGLVTASRVADVMATLKNGKPAAARTNYFMELVIARLTGRMADHYVSPAMEWGIETEPLAIAAYEIENDVNVDKVGMAIHPTVKYFSASPDGLVGADGLLETKCPNTSTHLAYMLEGRIPEEYQIQMLAELACTERAWCDFVSFDPRLPKKLQMLCVRFRRDDVRIKAMENEVEKFIGEVEQTVSLLDKLANGRNVLNISREARA